ncbi:EpsG family protein [Aeromonas caviae]|uniref:EpsG family protein n=1 Tax=Aeromonas caviae TaxID=648 RepID=UPI00191E4B9D|nr:EpsG family protein [Aeromonas caviae]MBL0559084.1 EpsG family protein [Aeromonas caviae]MDY7799418.1 EpsG family protein [Aeromonas caviae]
MQEYFLVFIFLSIFSIADLYVKQNVRFSYFIIPLVVIIVFVGFRWETGNDWLPYLDYYQSMDDISYKSDSFEIGFRFISYVIKTTGVEYSYFLFMVSSFYIIVFSISFLYTKRPSLILFIFYSTYLLGFMGTLRQTIAISFCLIAFFLLYYKKRFLPYLLLLVASFFHITALFSFLAIIVPKKIISKSIFFIVSMIAFLFFYLDLINVIFEYALQYTAGIDFIYNRLVVYNQLQSGDLYENGKNAILIGSIKRVALSIIFWFFLKRIKNDIGFLGYFFNLYFISVVFFLLFQGPLLMIALRGTLYFAFLEIFLIAAICYSIKDKILKIISFFIISLYMLLRIYSAVYSYHPDLYVPYKAVFYNQNVIKKLY